MKSARSLNSHLTGYNCLLCASADSTRLDGSGWAWFIPRHDGSVSVGIIIKQELLAQKKQACGACSSKALYLETLKQTLVISKLLEKAHMRSDDIKTASGWSYRASDYASLHLRITGDVGCFIDPFFSSACTSL